MSNTIEKIILRFLWIEKRVRKYLLLFWTDRHSLAILENHKKMKRKSISDTDNSIHGNNKEETTIEKGFENLKELIDKKSVKVTGLRLG